MLADIVVRVFSGLNVGQKVDRLRSCKCTLSLVYFLAVYKVY